MKSLVMFLVMFLTLAGPAAVHADHFLDGVPVPGNAGGEPGENQPAIERDEFDVLLNFDEINAPCGFSDTQALGMQYINLLAVFEGPAAGDGGGILDMCGGFSVNGFSEPNFLAFNCDALFEDGGTPRGPEKITSSIRSMPFPPWWDPIRAREAS